MRVLEGRDYSFSDKFELNGVEYEEPTPQLFAFNSPYGACPTCQGFGRVAGIDEDAVIPNKALSLRDGAIVCWNSEKHIRHLHALIRIAPKYNIALDVPYSKLPASAKKLIWQGAPKDGFLGIDGFFKEVEKEAQYKMHYRVLLNRYRGYTTCPDCGGSRLRKEALYVKVAGKTIFDIVQMSIAEAYEFIKNIEISRFDREIAQTILNELEKRLGYLVEVGVHYLTLNRPANTLSGGESQRINLATSLGSSLMGSIYILDEPSIGLHQHDSARLIQILKKLRDIGNTVVVVEHDREIIEAADEVIDLGIGAGRHGGSLVFQGSPAEIVHAPNSLTGKYLKNKHAIPVPERRRPVSFSKAIEIEGALENNLKNIIVNNAGVGRFKDILELTEEDFDYTININLKGTFFLTQRIFRDMQQRRSGHIIFITSVAAEVPFEQSGIYCMSKFGQKGLVEVLRLYGRKCNVRITNVMPGAVYTPMWGEAAQTFQSRMMMPEDVAKIVVAAYLQPERTSVEEIVLRPIAGDL